MNKYSTHIINARARLLDAEALLFFLRDQENLCNLLNNENADVTLGALIEKAWGLVSGASGDCEALSEAHNEDLEAEMKEIAAQARARTELSEEVKG